MPTFGDIEKQVESYLKDRGFRVERVNDPQIPADLIVSGKESLGVAYGIEIKVGPEDRFLPFSGYAQAVELKAQKHLQPILFTNLVISQSIAEMLNTQQIPCVRFGRDSNLEKGLRALEMQVSGSANLSGTNLSDLTIPV